MKMIKASVLTLMAGILKVISRKCDIRAKQLLNECRTVERKVRKKRKQWKASEGVKIAYHKSMKGEYEPPAEQ